MKKLAAILLAIPVLLSTACRDGDIDTSKIALDYGRVRHTALVDIDQLGELTYNELQSAIDSKINFVLLVYGSPTCGCWTDFKPIVRDYINAHWADFKVINANNVPGNNSYGIYAGADLMPSIVFFRRGKLIRQTVYGKLKENNRKMFKQYHEFEAYMKRNVYAPHMIYLDKEVLDEKISTNEYFNLYVARTGCGDCAAVDKNILYKWSTKNAGKLLANDLYIFDIAPYRGTDQYQVIKDYCGLSVAGNPTFGYDYGEDHGFVPTFQRRHGALIEDMITVLNDYASEELVVTSYFNQARINASPMLRDTGDKYLFNGKTIEENQRMPWGGVDQSLQLKWHTPILELYLSTYVK